jgi:hypothetical protein
MPGFKQRTVDLSKRGYRGFGAIQDVADAIAFIAGPGVKQMVRRASYKIGLEIENELKKYPKSPSYPLKWASDKQRRWYFWMRRSKGLPVEYTRTSDPMSQKLGQRWTTKQKPWGAVVGNPATYAPYVQSEEYQTEMHEATGWATDRQAADEIMSSPVVDQIIAAEMQDIVDRAFRAFR